LSPGGPHSPLERWDGCFGTPAGEAAFWVSHPSVRCKMSHRGARNASKRASIT